MRAGLVVSLIGHVGAVLMTLLAWEASSSLPREGVAVVPIEIVDMAPEANVRALALDVPDEEVAPQDEEETRPNEAQPTPAPNASPRRPQPRTQDDEFNLADADQFIDRQRDAGQRRQDGAPADRNQRAAGLGTAERASLEGRIATIVRSELQRCWRTVADMQDPERLRVTLAFRLNRDGSLNGQPRVVSPTNYTFDPQMAEAVNRALRAVRTCDPIDRLPEDPIVGEYFDVWREQEVTFGLRVQ